MLQPRLHYRMPEAGATSRAAIARAVVRPGPRPVAARVVNRPAASAPSADADRPACPPRGRWSAARFCAQVTAEALAGAVLLAGMGLLPLALGRLLGIA